MEYLEVLPVAQTVALIATAVWAIYRTRETTNTLIHKNEIMTAQLTVTLDHLNATVQKIDMNQLALHETINSIKERIIRLEITNGYHKHDT
jgi:hypothetical protein